MNKNPKSKSIQIKIGASNFEEKKRMTNDESVACCDGLAQGGG